MSAENTDSVKSRIDTLKLLEEIRTELREQRELLEILLARCRREADNA